MLLPNGQLDIIFQLWWLRCFGVLLILSPFWGVYLFYRYKVAILDSENFREEIATEAKIKIAECQSRPQEREIKLNVNRRSEPEPDPEPERPEMIPAPNTQKHDYEQDGLLEPFSNMPVKEEQVRLLDNIYMDKNKVNDFIDTALKENGPGLAISQWKSQRKWLQEDVENLLDYLCELGFVTQRKAGVACSFTGDYSAGEIIKKISEDQSLTLP